MAEVRRAENISECTSVIGVLSYEADLVYRMVIQAVLQRKVETNV
jgi:hypothetical protein